MNNDLPDIGDVTTAKIDGVNVRFARSGQSDGIPVLFTSPWPESIYAFRGVLPAIKVGSPVIAVDLPGFGRSESRPDLMSPVGMGDFVLKLAAHFGIERMHISQASVLAGPQFVELGEELELLIDTAESDGVRRLDEEVVKREFEGDVALNGREAFAHLDAFTIVPEAIAVHLALDFSMPVERGFERAELLQKVDGPFLTDAGRTGDVIDRVASEREVVGDEFGLDAHKFLHLDRIVDGVVFGWIQHIDAIGDQLHHVLITGDDDDVEALLLGAPRDGTDNVVRFVAGELQDGDIHSAKKLANVRDLRRQVLGHLGAIGFVIGEGFLALGFADALEDGGHILRLEGLRQLPDHVVENEDRLGGDAGGGAHGRRFGPEPRVIGAEDEAVGVDEEKTAVHS